MQKLYTPYSIFCVAVVVALISLYTLYWCFEVVEPFCVSYRQARYLGVPALFYSLGTALTMAILFFRPEQSFKRWTRFALWALPLSTALAAYLITSRIGGAFGEPTPGFKTLVAALPFFVISMTLIFWPVKHTPESNKST